MEQLPPWADSVAGGLAAVVLIGGFLMMFTGIFTSRDR